MIKKNYGEIHKLKQNKSNELSLIRQQTQHTFPKQEYIAVLSNTNTICGDTVLCGVLVEGKQI
jgi:Ni,Fe-hydrogenase maturation factor